MPHLTQLGLIHTIIGIIALILAMVSLVRHRRISPANSIGKLYVVFTIAACVTSFGVQKLGHLSPAHSLSVLILLLLPVAVYFQLSRFVNTTWEYVGMATMTFTVFLSFIPTVVETLTRVPVDNPIAENDNAPVIKMLLLALAIVFATIIVVQIRRARALRKSTV